MIVGCGDLTILLVGLGFHCFLLKCKEKLRHSLGRPSRSDFVHSEFVEETNMEDNKSMTVKKTVKSGITFGSALAMVISYTTWKSVGWAIFHGLLSWVYVIYFFLRY